MFFQKPFQVPSASSFSETRHSSSLRLPSNLAEEDLGLFSPPSSPEAPASEERKGKHVCTKMEETSRNSISSSLDTLRGASGSSAKTAASPSKPVKGGENWDDEIDDLLGDDSDEEVCIKRVLFQHQPTSFRSATLPLEASPRHLQR